ncbi:TonB-dependent receptor [Reichenbachiella agarivorans]|uniref:TonB-dependent receptor n=1 Tax=Reichenbachiella agarivorans TaxID=2979464 RepID=A0ABY6CQA0_9BACT|nr:TonB-dependent receptor [Reichenbachiella agarivorans]UXP32682.1 TonB-dependent receptor [Reichenbachiella agarivorans]
MKKILISYICSAKLSNMAVVLLILLGLNNYTVQAQDRSISGKIVSTTGDELPGVSILVKGTTNGTVSNVSGQYTLSVGNNAETLVFSFIGMKTQELAIGSRSVIDVTMEEDVASLQEVIVTGYSSESKKTITGSIDALDTEKAFSIPSTSAAEGFQGRLSGVTVVSNGSPGAAPIVRIRGVATTGNNDPLYIIDGYQTNDPDFLTDLNTSDIESVTVLKDAAVSSVYGARATNGVIVIKTRKGGYDVSGKPKVTLDISYGVQTPVTAPDMLNSEQLGEVFWESAINDGVAPSHPQFGVGAEPNISGYYRGDRDLPYDAETNRLTKTSAGTDWFGEIFEDATYQNYYVSVNGGSEASKYMMSMGYLDREGILTGTGYDRYTGRANTEFSIKERLRIGQNLSFAYSRQTLFPGQNGDDSPLGLAYRASPLMPAYDEGGNFAGTYQSAAGLGNAQNPLAVMTRAKDNLNSNMRIYGDAYAEVDIIDGLTARSNIGVNYRSGTGDVFNSLNPEHSEAITTNNLTTARYISSGYVWTNTLRYEKTVGKHNVGVIAGIEAISDHFEFTAVSQQDFLLNDVVDNRLLGYGVGATSIGSSTNTTSTLFSYFGQLKYNYAGKYILTATVRRDKTSRFEDGNNTGVFPAVSAGWVLSEEAFIPDLFSNLKLRGSYGEMGNQSIPNATPTINVNQANNQLAFYNFGGNYTPGAVLSTPGNPNLTWETSVQKNIGVDIGLLNDKLEITFDYFDLTSKDNIISTSLPSTAPVASNGNPYINNGEINNRGFDLSLNYGNTGTTSDFTYNIGLKFSKYKNEIIKTDELGTSIVGGNLRGITFTNSAVGGPVSSFYGRKVIGIFRSETEVSAAPDQGFDTPAEGVGRFQYADIDNNGIIDDNDRTNIGSPNPDFTYGINIDVAYKGFDLALFFTGSQGNEIYNYTRIFTDFPSFYDGNRSTRVLDAFNETTNPNGNVPALSKNVTNNETQANSYFVEDGSYFRMKNIQLGYTLPSTISSKAGMSRARVYVQASNLFTITDYSGLDPEIGRFNNSDIDTGIDFGSYPTSQTYLIGLSVDF